MGWSNGSSLMSDIIEAVKPRLAPKSFRQTVYEELIKAFEDYDCDTLDECHGMDTAFDAAMRKVHPEDYE